MYSSLKRLLIFIRLNRLIFELQRKPLTWEVGIHVYPDATNCKENKQNRERDVRMSLVVFFFLSLSRRDTFPFTRLLRFYPGAICDSIQLLYPPQFVTIDSRIILLVVVAQANTEAARYYRCYNETVRPNFYQRT